MENKIQNNYEFLVMFLKYFEKYKESYEFGFNVNKVYDMVERYTSGGYGVTFVNNTISLFLNENRIKIREFMLHCKEEGINISNESNEEYVESMLQEIMRENE